MDDIIKKALLKALTDGGEDNSFACRLDAVKALDEYDEKINANEMPEVGDHIVRTELGEGVYNAPKKNQAAIVIEKWDEYKYEEHGTGRVNGVIRVALSKDMVVHLTADLGMYKTVDKVSTTNVFGFKKKG
jgi:hypothetical protein